MAGLILLRFFLVILVMNNIPFTGMQLGGFRPPFNESYMSDEQKFFDIGRGIASGQIVRSSPSNIGYGIFLAPFIYFYDAKEPIDIAKPIFIFQEFMLFPVALILVAFIAIYLFKSYFWAAISAGLFAVYPWLILGLGKMIGYHNAIPAFHHQLWIIIQSDYISALFVYLSFYLLFRIKKVGLLAVSSGIALLTRMTNIWPILIIFGVFLFNKRFKELITYSIIFGIAYSPQWIFNTLAFGAPWLYGYSVGFSNTSLTDWFNFRNLWWNFHRFSPDNYFFWFLIVSMFFILCFVFGYKYFYKVDKGRAVTVSAWFWSYLLFFGIFTDALQSLRYFLPAIPAFVYFFIAGLLYISKLLAFGSRKLI